MEKRASGAGKSVGLGRRRYTYDEWIDSPLNTPRSELVDGEPVERMPGTPDHASVINEAWDWLRRAERAGYGRVFCGPTGVLLDADGARRNAREPDVFFIRKERVHIVTSKSIEGVPDLAIEVLSPSTRRDNLPGGAIWRDYERFGVPAYWAIDVEYRVVAQYRWSDGHYGQPTVLGEDDLLESPLFPAITLPVRQLFVDVLQPERPLAGKNLFATESA